MTRAFLPAALVLAFASPCLADNKDWTPELNAIADKCSVSRANLQWIDAAVRWVEVEKLTYAQAKCVIDGINAHGVPTKQGFVANDR